MNLDAEKTAREHTVGDPLRVLPGETWIWIFAVLTFGIGDVVTTSVGQSLGLWEANPIFRTLFEYAPVPVVISAGLGAQLLLGAWLASRVPYPLRLVIPIVFSVIGVYIVVTNCQAIFATL